MMMSPHARSAIAAIVLVLAANCPVPSRADIPWPWADGATCEATALYPANDGYSYHGSWDCDYNYGWPRTNPSEVSVWYIFSPIIYNLTSEDSHN